MKIFDASGRLFGKINFIDLVVIAVLASFIPIAYLGYKMAVSQFSESRANAKVEVRFSGIFPELAGEIKAGDTEVNADGRVIGKIENVVLNKPASTPVTMPGKAVMEMIEHPRDREITADLHIFCVNRNGTLYYKTSIIKIGNTFNFSSDRYEISGTVIGIKSVEKKGGAASGR